MRTIELCVIKGVVIYQDLPDDPRNPSNDDLSNPNHLRVHFVSDLDDDVDGAEHSYRLDNKRSRGALDDIHKSADYPDGDWHDILVPDPHTPSRAYVDENGFCVSQTAYRHAGFAATDRRSWVDAVKVPYSVAPSKVRKLCRGVLLGCKARVTRTTDNHRIDAVCADISGNKTGEASDKVCKFFDKNLSAYNGDSRKIYLYEFWPGKAAELDGVTYQLQRAI